MIIICMILVIMFQEGFLMTKLYYYDPRIISGTNYFSWPCECTLYHNFGNPESERMTFTGLYEHAQNRPCVFIFQPKTFHLIV